METKITQLISEQFGIPISEITDALELRNDLNATDLEMADFFQELERTFAITISNDDAKNIHTIGDLITYIADHAEETS